MSTRSRTNVRASGPTDWPADWRTVPLWSLFDRVKDVGHPNEEMLSVYRNYGVVRKDSRDDNFNKTAENRDIYQLVDDGWLIVNRMKAWQGSVGISKLRGIVSGHYICFRPRHSEDHRYLNWLLRSDVYAYEYARLSRGVRPNQIEIDNDELRSLPVRLPGIEEQRRIADFLDAETAQLDQVDLLRAKQVQRLSELSMTEVSDAFELGDQVPHVRLGYLAVVQTGVTVDASRTNARDSVTRPYLRVANVQAGYVNLDEVASITVPRAMARSSTLQAGDVLMTEGGDLDKLGRGTVWEGQIEACLHQNHVFAVRVDPQRLDTQYLALLTRAARARIHFERTGTKTTNLASTSSSKIRDLRVPLPPLAQQRAIVKTVLAGLAMIESLVSSMERQRRLLSERRQALITAAVTGQFDVVTGRGADLS